jgi:acetyl-CoA carboxylase carboxyl transferase subunit beta
VVLDARRLQAAAYECGCGHHFAMHAEAWIAFLADAGTWEEHWTDLRPLDVDAWAQPRPYRAVLEDAACRGLNEAVRAGRCQLAGRPTWLAAFDFRFVGGTLGAVAGERFARAAEQAIRQRVPLIVVTASGGARMQEGVWSLLQMAKVNGAVVALQQAGVPYLSVLSNPTYGGTAASLALLGDVNIAEPGAAIGFTGPRIIRQATHQELPPDFQTAEFQMRHGQVDMIVPRHELRATLASLLALLL